MYNLFNCKKTQMSFSCAVSMFFGLSLCVQFEAHKNLACFVNIPLRQQFYNKVPVWTEQTVECGLGRNQ
jgi:hypothetical protein